MKICRDLSLVSCSCTTNHCNLFIVILVIVTDQCNFVRRGQIWLLFWQNERGCQLVSQLGVILSTLLFLCSMLLFFARCHCSSHNLIWPLLLCNMSFFFALSSFFFAHCHWTFVFVVLISVWSLVLCLFSCFFARCWWPVVLCTVLSLFAWCHWPMRQIKQGINLLMSWVLGLLAGFLRSSFSTLFHPWLELLGLINLINLEVLDTTIKQNTTPSTQ